MGLRGGALRGINFITDFAPLLMVQLCIYVTGESSGSVKGIGDS